MASKDPSEEVNEEEKEGLARPSQLDFRQAHEARLQAASRDPG